MNIFKSFAVSILKPLLLASVQGYGVALQPALVQVLTSKGNIPSDQANLLAADLVTVASGELTNLINKL